MYFLYKRTTAAFRVTRMVDECEHCACFCMLACIQASTLSVGMRPTMDIPNDKMKLSQSGFASR